MSVEVKIDTKEFELELAAFLNENCMEIAKQVAADARASVNVITGDLRKSIKAKKSKFDDGGAIVVASKYYAFFVEYGTSKMTAKPFLRPALDKNIDAARAAFGAK